MSTIQPLFLSSWIDNITLIKATEVRGEFLNIYNLVNGNIDADNIKDGAITQGKLAANSVKNDNIVDVAASKLTGTLSYSQLPAGLLQGSGGDVTGTLTFNLAADSPFIKSYLNTQATVIELGTGTSKLTLVMNPTGNLFELRLNGVAVLTVTADGTLIPKKLQIPVV